MIEAAYRAAAQMFTPPFRSVLLKSVGLALAIIVVLVIALQRLLSWLTGEGTQWAQGALGPTAQDPLNWLSWFIAIALGLGLIVGAVMLMPAVTSLVASFFSDEIADIVERSHYPADPPGSALPLSRALIEGVKTAALALLIYLAATPFLLLAGVGAIVFFLATAFLLGREYFYLAAMRFHAVPAARMLRRRHRGSVFAAGMLIAAFAMVPILNLATPLFGTALMVHMHKRLVGAPRRDVIEPKR